MKHETTIYALSCYVICVHISLQDEAIPEQNAEAAERLSQKVAALYA